MNNVTLFNTILSYGLLVSMVLTALVFVQYRLGFENSVRNEQGEIDANRKASPLGLLMAAFVFTLIIGVPVLANASMQSTVSTPLSFLTFFIVGYGIFFVGNLWDLLILDYVLVVRHRPSFIKLPDTPYYTTMRPHIKGWLRGLRFGLVTSLVSAIISTLIL